jgi:hypothetical protein
MIAPSRDMVLFSGAQSDIASQRGQGRRLPGFCRQTENAFRLPIAPYPSRPEPDDWQTSPTRQSQYLARIPSRQIHNPKTSAAPIVRLGLQGHLSLHGQAAARAPKTKRSLCRSSESVLAIRYPCVPKAASSFRPYWIYFSSLTVSAVQFHRRTGITFLRSGLLAWKLPETDRA